MRLNHSNFIMMTQTQAPSIFRMFYTHKRTQMLLEAKGVRVKNIEKVSINKPNGEFYCAVHVVYRVANGGRCSTFISCKEYLARATEKRKIESENYVAHQQRHNPSEFHVYPKGNPVNTHEPRQIDSENTAKHRTVFATPEGVFCDCEDFNNQASYLSEHPYLWERIIKQYQICKHCLTTTSIIGYSSLNNYLKSWQPGGKLNQLAVTMNRMSRQTA